MIIETSPGITNRTKNINSSLYSTSINNLLWRVRVKYVISRQTINKATTRLERKKLTGKIRRAVIGARFRRFSATCNKNVDGLLAKASGMLCADPKLRDNISHQFVHGFMVLPVRDTQFNEKCCPKALRLLLPFMGISSAPNKSADVNPNPTNKPSRYRFSSFPYSRTNKKIKSKI